MIHFVIAGSLSQLTGGYIYDRRIVTELRALGTEVRVHELAGTFPVPDDAARQAARSCMTQLAEGARVVADGLALPAFTSVIDDLASATQFHALVHHPLSLETGLTLADRSHLTETEVRTLHRAKGIIVTSTTTRSDLIALGLAGDRVAVVEPGLDAVPATDAARGQGGSGPLRLLCVATVTKRKGHDLLIDALSRIPDLDWHLDCAGSLERDPKTVANLRSAIFDTGLDGRITLHGEVSPGELKRFYENADAFVLASWHEGYGMALAEAMRYGVPVVATDAGAIPQTVPRQAGILVSPGNVLELAEALQRTLTDHGLRNRMALAARAVPRSGWPEAGRQFLRELEAFEARHA